MSHSSIIPAPRSCLICDVDISHTMRSQLVCSAVCRSELKRRDYEQNRENIRARKKAYYENNLEKVAACQRASRERRANARLALEVALAAETARRVAAEADLKEVEAIADTAVAKLQNIGQSLFEVHNDVSCS